jgi:hypothetical protein
MEDDSNSKNVIIGGLGLVGAGSLAAAFMIPKIGIYVALIIILLALLVFGGYFLFKRARARRQSRHFEGAIETQTAVTPSAISDPNRRAALDKLRQKFQNGLREFKSRGKDIYKLPWYVIIGESGSGKTEAIRHSGIEFPPGLQDELQGSGGTLNMDWWFTNRGIILDTAGSMIFNESKAGEAPEWREFLRLLKKARPHSPVNGLFLVLSVESLIKDSSDVIAQKASRLAQQLDMIQRTLDVRFPVYLLVTKCDLLTGFREFFDNIDDPLLQHQIFGWSNPDPLDTHFRPELMDQHLKTVAERISRRRLALLRDCAPATRAGETQFFVSPYQQTGATTKRRLDEVDAFFALPESVMRLAPRLRRYLETVFVAGEWSAKPVFLRGVYFTSSMRKGRALDEAMAMATGIPLDQLPEDRRWDENRSYFMRDLFLEKVFRESGLVTRASNTRNLLRQRRLLIMGVAATAMLVLMLFCFFSYKGLKDSIGTELALWRVGADNWNRGEWASSIVRPGTDDPYHFTYAGDEPVAGTDGKTVVGYQKTLQEMVQRPLSVGWIFKPMTWLSTGKDLNRQKAQTVLFEGGVLKPLVFRVRDKMERQELPANNSAAVGRHREALLSLIRLESDFLAEGGSLNGDGDKPTAAASIYLGTFLSYLTDTNQSPDTNLVEILRWDYAGPKSRADHWPPDSVLVANGSLALSNNPAIKRGLDVFREANKSTQKNIENEVTLLNDFVNRLAAYHEIETAWLAAGQANSVADVNEGGQLSDAKKRVDECIARLDQAVDLTAPALTNFTTHYALLERAAMEASASTFRGISTGLPNQSRTTGLFADITSQMSLFAKEAANAVHHSYDERSNSVVVLDRDQMAQLRGGVIAHQQRWNLYLGAAALANETILMSDAVIGNEWKRFSDLKNKADQFDNQLAGYSGPLAAPVAANCQLMAGAAINRVKGKFLDEYVSRVANKISDQFDFNKWSSRNVADSDEMLGRITLDLKSAGEKLNAQEIKKLRPLSEALVNGTAGLQSKLGFPVFLNANPDLPMTLADLASFKRMLDPLTSALKDPAWTGILQDADQLRANALLKQCRSYHEVLAALVNNDGTAALLELYFVPPKPGPDASIISDYRQTRVRIGENESAWVELPALMGEGRKSLVKGTVAAPLNISFRKLATLPAQSDLDLNEWAFLRLIREGGAQQMENGSDWQVTRKLMDAEQGISGNVAFQIVTERPFPKQDDWPKK